MTGVAERIRPERTLVDSPRFQPGVDSQKGKRSPNGTTEVTHVTIAWNKRRMSTYTSLTYHAIFSTKYRIPRIDETLKDDLYAYIGGIIRGEEGQLLEIGGTADHVHILAGFHPTVAVSLMLQHIKGNSSKWINAQKTPQDRFEWQGGYGAFTVSQSQVPTVRQYIQQQAEHHKKQCFKDEFLAFLKRHNIDYDPKYVFETEHVG